MNLRSFTFLATLFAGGVAATAAGAHGSGTGEVNVRDKGPYAYLFEHTSRAAPRRDLGPYAYLFAHQFPENRVAVVKRGDLFSGEPDALR